MRKLFTLLATLFFALPSTAPAADESPALVTVVKAGRLLDPRTGKVLSPAAVLIENGKIKDVGPPSRVQASTSAGVKTVDLGGATLLPGLIDPHTHLLLDVIVPTGAGNQSPIQRRVCSRAAARDCSHVAECTGAAWRAVGSRRLGEWFHHSPQRWALGHRWRCGAAGRNQCRPDSRPANSGFGA